MKLYFHQIVQTPNGFGTVQGRLQDKDGRTRILVSHARNPKHPHKLEIKGLWKLKHYLLEEIDPA